jgi:hypothetical protein
MAFVMHGDAALFDAGSYLGMQKEVRCVQLMRIHIVEHDSVSGGVDHGVALI